MNARHAMLYLAAFAGLWGAEPVSARSKSAFDGEWIGESSRGFPATNTYRFTNLVVKNNALQLSGHRCRAQIHVQGDHQSGWVLRGPELRFCPRGKFEANKVSIKRQTNELTCEIVARRE